MQEKQIQYLLVSHNPAFYQISEQYFHIFQRSSPSTNGKPMQENDKCVFITFSLYQHGCKLHLFPIFFSPFLAPVHKILAEEIRFQTVSFYQLIRPKLGNSSAAQSFFLQVQQFEAVSGKAQPIILTKIPVQVLWLIVLFKSDLGTAATAVKMRTMSYLYLCRRLAKVKKASKDFHMLYFYHYIDRFVGCPCCPKRYTFLVKFLFCSFELFSYVAKCERLKQSMISICSIPRSTRQQKIFNREQIFVQR